MSRTFKGNSDRMFRVVVEHRMADDSSTYSTSTYGPFATVGAARSCITVNTKYWGANGRKFIPRIEVAFTIWQVAQ